MKKSVKGFKGIILKSFCNLKSEPNAWRDALFTANGETGIIESFLPCDDVVIFNNTKCVMDTVNPMETAEIHSIDREVKKAAVTRGNAGIWIDFLKNHWREKYGLKDYVACSARPYFPAALMHIKCGGEIENYLRKTDFYTGEISCECLLNGGELRRRSFVSRADGISVVFTECESKNDFTLYFENFDDMFCDMERDDKKFRSVKFPETVKTSNDGGEMSFYGKPPESHIGDIPENPVTELSHSGFWTAIKILSDGKISSEGDCLKIQSATKILLLAKTDYLKSGITEMREVKRHCERALKNLRATIGKSQPNELYERLLSRHVKLHFPMMNSAELNLSDGGGFADADEIRINQKGAEDGEINADWLDLLYVHSRFVSVCSHGYSTARLGGIWVGNLLPAWSGDHTLNANTNAQICGLNTGNLPECTESYINFLLDFAPDWLINAKNINGIENAIKAPARTDGAGCGLFFSTPAGYPMIYWNAGAAWQLLPVFEMWECFGNRRIKLRRDLNVRRLKALLDLTDERTAELERERSLDLEREILKPLLTKLMNFWLGFADRRFYTDAHGAVHADDGTEISEGGKYIFTPCYSPENAPDGEKNVEQVCANSAMDIAAAKDSVRMFKKFAQKGIIKEYDFESVEIFNSRLPEYITDGHGALKEWALAYTENRNNHRHSSHLYAAWPAYEAARNTALAHAVRQAAKDRRTYTSDQRTTGFGRMQLAMAAARIRDKSLFRKCLYDLVCADFEYDSLMTGHDMGRAQRSFCQDNAASIHGVINEALVYSDDKGIILLPCGIWQSGKVRGLMTRLGIRINFMSWKNGRVKAEFEALSEDIETVICYMGSEINIKLKRGEPEKTEFRNKKTAVI